MSQHVNACTVNNINSDVTHRLNKMTSVMSWSYSWGNAYMVTTMRWSYCQGEYTLVMFGSHGHYNKVVL